MSKRTKKIKSTRNLSPRAIQALQRIAARNMPVEANLVLDVRGRIPPSCRQLNLLVKMDKGEARQIYAL